MVITEPILDSKYRPAVESEVNTDAEYAEEQLTETEMDEQRASEVEITTEQLPTNVKPQSQLEIKYLIKLREEAEEGEEEEGEEKKEAEKHKHQEE
ncbi:uncharacterized protein LOC143175005 [Nomia melanderi]|uniref:uncharacterized protein LOC143175005 n=1 Tax=Nomia melanderi TaxID=2448451 RepID=UPI003FCD510C